MHRRDQTVKLGAYTQVTPHVWPVKLQMQSLVSVSHKRTV